MPAPLTEMDCTTLAIVARDGPLSAYDVRKVFADSLTATWSSSTGSVYPSIRRLSDAGLVSVSTPEGARSRRELAITPSGRSALDRWLRVIDPESAGPTPDPIRTKMYFLALLDPRERTDLLAQAMRSTGAAIAAAEQRLAERAARGADALPRLAAVGVLYELRARLEWLGWLMSQIRTEVTPGESPAAPPHPRRGPPTGRGRAR